MRAGKIHVLMLLLVCVGTLQAADAPTQQILRNEGLITCTAANEQYGASANIVNGYGINEDLYHPFEHWDGENGGLGMWVSGFGGGGDAQNNPAGLECSTWLHFQFDDVYPLGQMWIWNHNQWRPDLDETNRGLKNVQIHYTSDGQTWNKLGDFTIPQAVGAEWIEHNYEVDFAGVDANSVLITAEKVDGNYGSNYYGMSEIMFGLQDQPYDPYSKHPQEATISNGEITATASSNYNGGTAPIATINGALLQNNFREGNNGGWWHTDGSVDPVTADPNNTAEGVAWLRYDFDKAYNLGTMWVWNMNQIAGNGDDLTGRGLKKVYIDYLDESGQWHRLMNSSQNYYILDQSSGNSIIEHTNEINFGGVSAVSVVITADQNDGMWGDPTQDPYYGLNEVLFGIANTIWTAPGEPEIILPEEDAVHDTKITAHASSTWNGPSPQNTVNGAGLNWNTLLHDNNGSAGSMWHADGNTTLDSANPSTTVGYEWIQYDFDKVYPLGTMWVWNHNQSGLTSRGLKKVYIEYTSDGETWNKLYDGDNDYFILAEASGENNLAFTDAINFGAADANAVVITADAEDGHWGGAPYLGLSEVRFGIAGTQYRGHPVPVLGDLDDDFDIDAGDLGIFSASWLNESPQPPVESFIMDDFEDYVLLDPNLSTHWSILESEGVTSQINLIMDPQEAHSGDQAMRWTWQSETAGATAEMLYSDAGLDISQYNQFSMWIYRHDYIHQTITVDLMDTEDQSLGSLNLQLFPDSTSIPVGQWINITMDLNLEEPSMLKSIKMTISNMDSTMDGTFDIDDIEFALLSGCQIEQSEDFNEDCLVDLYDFVIMANNWLAGTARE